MNEWTTTLSRTIDQRSEVLPPAWRFRQVSAAEIGEAVGNGVYRPGRNGILASRVLSVIRAAKDVIVVSSFLLADADVEACLLEAAQAGVRVYLLMATETRLEREPSESDSEFSKQVLVQHLAMLKALAGWTLIRSAPEFHAKVVLADPASGGAGILLTGNLTTEAMKRNEEIAVELTPTEVAEVFKVLRWAAWEAASHELLDPGRLRAAKPLGSLKLPTVGERVVATAGSLTSIHKESLRVIDSARNRLIVSSFGWELDHPIVKRLLVRAKEGLRVTVLCRVRQASMPVLLALAEAGAMVLGFGWLHAKAVWSDTGEAVVMSANLEPRGMDTSVELGIVLNGDRADSVEGLLRAWAKCAPWELLSKPRLGELRGKTQFWRERRLEECDVVAESPKDLGTVVAASAADMQAPEPKPPRLTFPILAHQVKYTWLVRAPQLAQGAKEIFRPLEPDEFPEDDGVPRKKRGKKGTKTGKVGTIPFLPPAFREPDGRVVVAVDHPDELVAAADVARQVQATAVVVRRGR